MANMTVEIHCDEQGQYSVGVEPEAQEMQEGMAPAAEGEGSNLKPVKSLDEALQVARDLFAGDTGAQAQQAEKQFKAGFAGGEQAEAANTGYA